MDSGAFSRIYKHGQHRPVAEYANKIKRWREVGNLLFAVTQDYMCEPKMLQITGLSIQDHQRLTVERYDELLGHDTGATILPVLQGYLPSDYARHIEMYGDRLSDGSWVGVGSVCKRQGSPEKILDVLLAIKMERPDLKLHGFGVKMTSLQHGLIRRMFYSADSMAWSAAARWSGGGQNDWRNAWKFKEQIESAYGKEYQGHLIEETL